IKLWGSLFSQQYDRKERARNRNLIGEANEIRNLHAHDMPFSYEDTYRHLDTLSRVAEILGAEEISQKLRDSAKAVMRVQFQEDARTVTRTKAAMEGTPLTTLKPWREVVA